MWIIFFVIAEQVIKNAEIDARRERERERERCYQSQGHIKRLWSSSCLEIREKFFENIFQSQTERIVHRNNFWTNKIMDRNQMQIQYFLFNFLNFYLFNYAMKKTISSQ